MPRPIKISLRILLGLTLLLIAILLTQFRMDIPREEMRSRYASAASSFMTIAGTELHFKDEGKGHVILLLHGTGASLHTWDSWVEALQDSFRVIRLDLPAFGLTGARPDHDYSLSAYSSMLHDFADRLDLEHFSLVGNSLGGAISYTFAETYPERVDKLILLDPWGFPDSSRKATLAFRMGRTPVLKYIVRYVTPRFMVEKSLKEVYGDDRRLTPALIDRYYDMLLAEGNREAFIHRLNTPMEFDRKKLENIQQPVLVLWGEKDRWIPFAIADSFLQYLPQAQLISYPDAGHVPMEEIPEASVKDARRFLLQP